MILLLGCAKSPLVVTSEARLGDFFLSGLSSRVVSYSGLGSDEKHLFFGSDRGTIFCLDLHSGGAEWKQEVEGSVDTTPISDGERVYAGTSKGKFYALALGDGEIKWEYEVAGEILGQPVRAEKYVFFGANDGVLYALNAVTGEYRWSHRSNRSEKMTVHLFASPVAEKNRIVAGFSDGSLVALSLHSGEVIWTQTLPKVGRFSNISTLSSFPEQGILTGQFSGNLYALKGDGRATWSLVQGGGPAKPLLDGKHLFVANVDHSISAVDRQSGDPIWTFKSPRSARWSGLATFKEHLLGTASDGQLYVLSRETGDLVWNYRFSSPIQGSPVPAGDKVWVLTRKGGLYALTLR